MPHAHPFFEFGCVFEGQADWIFPELEQKITVKANEWMLVPPGCYHFEEFEKSAEPTIGWIGFTLDPNHPVYDELINRSMIVYNAPKEPDNLQHYFVQLNTEHESTKPHWKTKLQLSLLSLIVCLLRESVNSEGRKTVTRKVSEIQPETTFTDLLELSAVFIRKYCGSPLSVEDLALRYGMSPSAYGRQFKKQFGITPKTYQMNARVERAQKHLTETSDTLYNIAYSYGFHDESHFSRVFKKHTGLTPGQWRTAHKPVSSLV